MNITKTGYEFAGTNTVSITCPALTGNVSITGNAIEGQTLTAITGGLNGSGDISYVLKRGDSDSAVTDTITGGTGSTYTPAASNVGGKFITVTVSRAYNTGSVISAAVGPVIVPVMDITFGSAGATISGGLTLSGTVAPSNATNQTIVWSTANTSAMVSGTSFSATHTGEVTVRATIANGTGPGVDFVKDFVITVTGTDAQMNEEDFGSGATIETAINVTNATEWETAKQTVIDGGNDKNYIINVNTAVTGITGKTSASNVYASIFGTVTGIKVSIRGTGSLTIGSGGGSIIRLRENQAVILRGPSLIGKNGNDKAVVYLYNQISGIPSAFTKWRDHQWEFRHNRKYKHRSRWRLGIL